MLVPNPDHLIRDEATLAELYGTPSEAAVMKEVDHVHPHYRAFIEAAPFVAIATGGPGGMDVSPRGDPAGFVVVADEHTVLIPDRRGNNRADTLRNLMHDDRIALLFLVPGVGETVRVNGRAVVSIDPALLARFPAPQMSLRVAQHRGNPVPTGLTPNGSAAEPSLSQAPLRDAERHGNPAPAADTVPGAGRLPRAVIVVAVERVYFQCGKALIRSELWNPEKRVPRGALPSTGTILRDLTAGKVGGVEYDRAYPGRLRETLY